MALNEWFNFCSSPVPSASEHKRGPYHQDTESDKAQGPEVPVIEHSPNEWTHKGKQAWAQRYTSMGAKINNHLLYILTSVWVLPYPQMLVDTKMLVYNSRKPLKTCKII